MLSSTYYTHERLGLLLFLLRCNWQVVCVLTYFYNIQQLPHVYEDCWVASWIWVRVSLYLLEHILLFLRQEVKLYRRFITTETSFVSQISVWDVWFCYWMWKAWFLCFYPYKSAHLRVRLVVENKGLFCCMCWFINSCALVLYLVLLDMLSLVGDTLLAGTDSATSDKGSSVVL